MCENKFFPHSIGKWVCLDIRSRSFYPHVCMSCIDMDMRMENSDKAFTILQLRSELIKRRVLG